MARGQTRAVMAGGQSRLFRNTHLRPRTPSGFARPRRKYFRGGTVMQHERTAASNRQQMTVLASSISAILGTQALSAGAQEVGDEILVTGSRIVRRDLDASSPIVTVD